MNFPSKETKILILIFLRGLKTIIKPLERWVKTGEIPKDLT